MFGLGLAADLKFQDFKFTALVTTPWCHAPPRALTRSDRPPMLDDPTLASLGGLEKSIHTKVSRRQKLESKAGSELDGYQVAPARRHIFVEVTISWSSSWSSDEAFSCVGEDACPAC